MTDIPWTCSCCGRRFDSLLLDVAFAAPAYMDWMMPEERESRIRLNEDLCVMDGEHYFIRSCLEVPVRGLDRPFVWGVWVSLSEASMKRAMELWSSDVDEDEPTRFGWLSNRINGYPDTLNLKASVRFRSGDLRPLIELEPTNHPLAVEQREGITIDRVREIIRPLMHH
jgi:hypothetical protein